VLSFEREVWSELRKSSTDGKSESEEEEEERRVNQDDVDLLGRYEGCEELRSRDLRASGAERRREEHSTKGSCRRPGAAGTLVEE